MTYIGHVGSEYGYKQGCRCDECRDCHAAFTGLHRAKLQGQQKSADDPRHGTYNFYVNHRCRCEPCKSAAKEQSRRAQEARYARAKDSRDPRHGTGSFYRNHGCRCDQCKSAVKVERMLTK